MENELNTVDPPRGWGSWRVSRYTHTPSTQPELPGILAWQLVNKFIKNYHASKNQKFQHRYLKETREFLDETYPLLWNYGLPGIWSGKTLFERCHQNDFVHVLLMVPLTDEEMELTRPTSKNLQRSDSEILLQF